MPDHVYGSYRAKFDDDDFNRFRGIACEGHTYTQTYVGLVYLTLFQSRKRL